MKKKRKKRPAGNPAEISARKTAKKRAARKNVLREAGMIFANGLLFRNPVLIGALGLYPVVAAGYRLQNALALSLMMLLMMVPTCLITGWMGEKLPAWVRPAMVLLLSAVFYLPASWILGLVMPAAFSGLGLYGALMIGNSIVLSRANDYAPSHITLAVLADSLGCTAGFALVLCAVSAIRELLAEGTLLGVPVAAVPALQRPAAYPFAGFILLGLFSALVQHLNNRLSHKKAAERQVRP